MAPKSKQASPPTQPVVAATTAAVDPQQSEEDLPFLARLLNHVLTPGSSLTSSVWTAFNVIMVWLFACWLLFVFSFPDNFHVWAFGVLGLGLCISTNLFMNEVFKAGLDFHSVQKREAKKSKNDDTKKTKKSVDTQEVKKEKEGEVVHVVKKNKHPKGEEKKKEHAQHEQAAAATTPQPKLDVTAVKAMKKANAAKVQPKNNNNAKPNITIQQPRQGGKK